MADVIQDVVIRIALQAIDAKLKAPDVQAATAAVKSVDQAINQANDRMAKSFESVEKETQKYSRELAKQAEAQRKASTEHVKGGKDVLDIQNRLRVAFSESAEGITRITRGVSFLAAAYSDDLARAVQSYILPAQAAVDITVGINKITAQLASTRRLLTTATTAQTAAEAGLTAATAAGNVAATTALATAAKYVVRLGGLTAIIGTAGTLLYQLKSAWDANSAAQERAIELDKQSIAIKKRREEALNAEREALERLAREHRSQQQGQATQIFNLQLEGLRTLDPTQRRDLLQGIDTGRLTNVRTADTIEGLRRGGNLQEAGQIAQDRLEQLNNEVTRLREILTTEREIAAEQKQQLLKDREGVFRGIEERGFVTPELRTQFGQDTERLVAQIEAEFGKREQALNGMLRKMLSLIIQATAQANAVERDAEVAAITAGD